MVMKFNQCLLTQFKKETIKKKKKKKLKIDQVFSLQQKLLLCTRQL